MHSSCDIFLVSAQKDLDSFDLAILAALQADASLTNAALSERINLSPSQCSRRRSALEQAGVIRGYRAELDAKRLGYDIEAIIRVTLSAHSGTTHDEFADFVAGLPEVTYAYTVTGDADYILALRVRSLEELTDFIHRRLLPHAQVSQVRSDIVLQTLVRDRGFSLDGDQRRSA